MERFAAEGIKNQRDQAIKSALKAKVPLHDLMEDFGLTESEVGDILKAQGGPSRKTDLLDARDEPKRREVIRPYGR